MARARKLPRLKGRLAILFSLWKEAEHPTEEVALKQLFLVKET